MDADMYSDIEQILIARQYIDMDNYDEMAEWADLQRNARDIYDLVYSPWYQKHSKKIRERDGILLDSIIAEALATIGKTIEESRIASMKKESLKSRIYHLRGR